jgi:hypothetical protein
MKKEDFERLIGRATYITLFDGTTVEGILEKTGDEKQDNNLKLVKNYYFVRDFSTNKVVRNLIFRSSHVKKVSWH